MFGNYTGTLWSLRPPARSARDPGNTIHPRSTYTRPPSARPTCSTNTHTRRAPASAGARLPAMTSAASAISRLRLLGFGRVSGQRESVLCWIDCRGRTARDGAVCCDVFVGRYLVARGIVLDQHEMTGRQSSFSRLLYRCWLVEPRPIRAQMV